MTLQTVMLAIMIGVALMITAGIAIWVVLHRERKTEREIREMHEAYDRYWDALNEAALDGDTERYDRIKRIGWRNFGVDAA